MKNPTLGRRRFGLRNLIFGLHLGAVLAAGLIIFILCFTGCALALGGGMQAWAERGLLRVRPPSADAHRQSIEEMVVGAGRREAPLRFEEGHVSSDPDAALVLTATDKSRWAVEPYTGEVRRLASPRVDAFLRTMSAWHVWLGDVMGRKAGSAVVGAADVVLLVLALSGLILWWPRAWNWRTI